MPYKRERIPINAEELALMPVEDQNQFFDSLSDQQAETLLKSWEWKARRKQVEPDGDWRFWVCLAGRGWGKTETIVQWAHEQATKRHPGERGMIVAPTAADARDTLIEGVSGFLTVIPEEERPIWQSTKKLLTWENGSKALVRSADEPDRMRGPQFSWAIADELAAWRRVLAFDNLKFGLRLGNNPRCAIATTPKPVKLLRDLIKDPKTVVTNGTTYENRANLAEDFFNDIISRYAGSRLGEQEIEGKILEDQIGALWTEELIEAGRKEPNEIPDMQRIVVSVDPAVTSGEASNNTGIIVAGKDDYGHFYVLDDLTMKGSPLEWALAVVHAYREWSADVIVVETNQGGDLIEVNIHNVDPDIPVKGVHAKRGKVLRAEPVVTLYQQKRAHHVGVFGMLESLMTEWMQGMDSPDALDALCQAAWELMLGESEEVPAYRQGVATFGGARRTWTTPR